MEFGSVGGVDPDTLQHGGAGESHYLFTSHAVSVAMPAFSDGDWRNQLRLLLGRSVAVSRTDRISACQCLNQVALSVNVNQNKAKQLPKHCKIDIPVTVQPNINCDAIPLSDLRFELISRNKNLEGKAFRPTRSGPSPSGAGHSSPLPSPAHAN